MVAMTMNISEKSLMGTNVASNTAPAETTPTSSRMTKLSPDCVAELPDPNASLLDCKLDFQMEYTKGSTGCNESKQVDNFNLPPIRTPSHTRKVPVILRKEQLLMTQLPEHAEPMLSDPVPKGLGCPPIPKPSPISNTKRAKSDNFAQMKRNERRSIFGHYFQQDQKHRAFPTSGTSSHHLKDHYPRRRDDQHRPYQRSSSCSILETSIAEHAPMDYRMFAPPKEYANRSAICGRFDSVDQFPALLDQDLERKALPPLPSPLRRFDNTGKNTTGMHGMYPLLTPIPILRRSSYSRSSHSFNGLSSTSDHDIKYGDNKLPPSLKHSFNLTESYRPPSTMGKTSSLLDSSAIAETTDTSSCSSSDDTSSVENNSNNDSGAKTGVRFDPRVTVTEFEDAVERMWYDDFELEQLKRETILIAQEYILTHPMEAEKYNRAKLDPVTNTYRKRALFSLPVLSSESVCSDDKSFCPLKQFHEFSKDQVKRILIVDPNPSILSLFCKSMSTMFPTAELVTAQNAERALKLVKESLPEHGQMTGAHVRKSPGKKYSSSSSRYEQQSGSFDIIIVEQSLYPCSPLLASRKREAAVDACGGNSSAGAMDKLCESKDQVDSSIGRLPWNLSMPDMNQNTTTDSPEKESEPTFPPLNKPGSFFQHDVTKKNEIHCRELRCGSDLIRSIVRLELGPSAKSSSRVSSYNKESMVSPFQWKALLIGVSMQPDHDAKRMQQAGADLIWGKPIPRVGDALRNQLLKALLDKRRGRGHLR